MCETKSVGKRGATGETVQQPGETAQQISTHEGGAPGDAPPDDASSGGEPPAPANDNTPGGDEPPTPASDNTPGKAGETAETASSGEPTEQTGSSDGGAPGEASPEQAEDSSAEEGSKEAAAGEAEALKTGGRILGLSFPLDGIQSRLPVAADAGFNADGTAESWANPNWLDGGHTAVRVGEVGDPNGSYLVNPTHEFVTDGGNPMPPGAVLFELGPNGSWMPIRRF